MCSLVVPTTRIMSSAGSRVDSSGPEEEQRGTKRKISLSCCGVCGSEEAKYRCPACLTRSCSLLCVKKHKEDSECSGVRNKTAFVTLSHFDEMALLSDYRFLEDTGRFADSATRDSLIRTPRTTLKAKRLAVNARKMNITLRFLPITFTKSQENSTIFLKIEKQFLWHLKLTFPQSGSEFSQRRVHDTRTLEQILTAYIHPTESDPVTRQKLKMYVQAPFEHVKVFMKSEGRKANSVRYQELDIQKSLRDNLSYKTLIEYPVLHVVLRDHWKEYPLKGPAEPASTRTGFATKDDGLDQKKEVVTQVSPPPRESCTPGGTNIWMRTRETIPETEPRQEKKAKRGAVEEEPEEGEIMDSNDDDDEEEEEEEEEEDGNAEKSTPCDKSCDDTNMEVIKDEPAAEPAVLDNVGDAVNKHIDSSRDQCVSEDVAASADDTTAARESAEVSMTKAYTAREPAPVHNRRDENESADSCGLE